MLATKKIKVLQINIGSRFGGVSSLIYNLYLNINQKKVVFDFLSVNKSSYEIYRKEINKMNGNLYSFNICEKGLLSKLKFYKNLQIFLKNHKYDIVHINSGSIVFDLISALAVKKSCQSKIVIHCHSMQNNKYIKKIISNFLKPFLSKIGDYYLACSKIAGDKMFSKKIVNSLKFSILNNGIDVEKYKFNSDIRQKLRKQYNISKDAIVVGNVARFSKIKNHDFMINLFNEYYQKNPNSYLILIGDGELEEEIKNKVKKIGIEQNVIFTGVIKNVYEYLNLMDIFIFPSESEGFGLAVLESQANGLYTIASTGVPKETKLTDLISYEQLNIKIWLKKLIEYVEIDNRNSYNEIIKSTDYNILKSSEKLLSIYENLLK